MTGTFGSFRSESLAHLLVRNSSLYDITFVTMRVASPLRRAVSLLLGCWLAIFILEPAVLHACPIHDVATPASHASHHPAHHTSHSGHQGCTCPGACCPSVVARVAVPPVFAAPRLVAMAESVPDFSPSVRQFDVQFALPPSIGPPRISG